MLDALLLEVVQQAARDRCVASNSDKHWLIRYYHF